MAQAQLSNILPKLHRHLMPTLLMMYVLAFLDRANVGFARAGLMSPAPSRPCEDTGVRDAPLCKLQGDAADFLDRPADQERRFGRDRSFVFLSDRPVLAR